MGRRKLNDDERMSCEFHLRLTQDEYDKLKALSEFYHLSMGYILRHLIADKYIETIHFSDDFYR